MKLFKGIVPVLLTPMDEFGKPDDEGIRSLVKFLISKKIGGLWVLGSASEDINLTVEERIQTIKTTSETVNGRIPILVGTGTTNVNETLEFINKIKSFKIDGVHIIYRDVKQSDKRMIDEVIRLADHSVFPIWLYNNVKRGKEITVGILRKLKKHPNIRGVKYGGFYQMPMIKAVMEETDDFQVMSAGNFFFSNLCYGGSAGTGSEANCWPEEYIKIYDLFKEGKIDEARSLQFKLINLASQIPRTDNGEYAAEEKYILSLRGICSEYVNNAYRTLNTKEKGLCRKVLKEYGFEWAKDF